MKSAAAEPTRFLRGLFSREMCSALPIVTSYARRTSRPMSEQAALLVRPFGHQLKIEPFNMMLIFRLVSISVQLFDNFHLRKFFDGDFLPIFDLIDARQ